MARKLKYIKGVGPVLTKLKRLEDWMVQRAMQLVLLLTTAAHYDFIYKIATGQVKDLFQLTPNSICYLLDMKWENAKHDKLFVYDGEYVKNIRIINIATDVDAAKKSKQIYTIGVTEGYQGLARVLEKGFITKVDGHDYVVPDRPLWKSYRQFIKTIIQQGDFNALDESIWLTRFSEFRKDFGHIVQNDLKRKFRKINLDIVVNRERKSVESMIETELKKGFMSPNDLVALAMRQKGNYKPHVWERILKKFKDAVDDGKLSSSVLSELPKSKDLGFL